MIYAREAESALLEAGFEAGSTLRTVCERYDQYVKAYSQSPRDCGREKMLLLQAADYLHGVIAVKVEGIVLTLSLRERRKIVLPRSNFYS